VPLGVILSDPASPPCDAVAGGYFGAVGPIDVSATFNGKCLVQ
jgi:hypothetical protein